MIRAFLIFAAAAVMLFQAVSAQSTPAAAWTSAIEYANPGSNPGELIVSYYSQDAATAYSSTTIPVNAHGAGELLIGSAGADPDFSGSAVLSSSVPVYAVYKQFVHQGDINYSPILYTSYSAGQAGSTSYVPTFLKKSSVNTQVGIQNLEAEEISLLLTFYTPTLNAATFTATFIVPANGSKLFNPSMDATTPALPSSFDGSLVIEATKTSDSTPANILASAIEMQTTGRRASAFEAMAEGGDQHFIASAMCNYGTTRQTTTFSIQNAGSINATVFIEFYDSTGKLRARTSIAATRSNKLQPNRRASYSSCTLSAMSRRSGSAQVYATSDGKYTGPRVPIAVVTKTTSNDGLQTHTTPGQPSTNLVLPYVRWADADGYKSTLFIMNAGSASANNVVLRYYDASGSLVATQNLATATKLLPKQGMRTSTPSAAGATSGGRFTGSVVIESSQPLVVLVRTVRPVTRVSGYKTLGEDYSGIPLP